MVIWREPKRPYRRSVNWKKVGEELRDNPGRWGKVCTRLSDKDAADYVGKIRRGDLAIGPGKFEATSEGTGVYARYLGDPGPEHAVDFSASPAAA